MAAAAYALLALAAGAMLPVQAGVNAQLASWVGGPIRAAFVSFVVGSVALGAVAVAFTRGSHVSDYLAEGPWWIWVGGLLGAFYVAVTVFGAPRLGAATLFVLFVAAQSAVALVLDHFGWVGFPVHHVTAGRIAGIVLVGAGVVLVRFA